MAVPFRAKDIPVERAEFGHPDVAILLTQLSYYKSGLTMNQMEKTLEHLSRLTDRQGIYKEWIEEVPEDLLPPQVADFSQLNLSDSHQTRDIVFPFLHKNMRVIDFWLNFVVYPCEAKQFPHKLVASSWDLCRLTSHPITGFSGTNGFKDLLPLTIQQEDLKELEKTNEEVLKKIIHPDNNHYLHLPWGITGKRIIDLLTSLRPEDCVVEPENSSSSSVSSSWLMLKDYADLPRVLLDVGALMLDLSNKRVAEEWLNRMPREANVRAAVYFDEKDELVVLDQQGTVTPLQLSFYRQKLHECVIYLDDIHTRGTDLQLPPGMAACVTLGKGMTRDRLAQACMRMRLLGEGHALRFLASAEVDEEIRRLILGMGDSSSSSSSFPLSSTSISLSADRIPEATDVVEWTKENSRTALIEGMVHWAFQGAGQCRSLCAKELMGMRGTRQVDMDVALKMMSECSKTAEVVDLEEFYGRPRVKELIPDIIMNLLQALKDGMIEKGNLEGTVTQEKINVIFKTKGMNIVERCRTFLGRKYRLSHIMDEIGRAHV